MTRIVAKLLVASENVFMDKLSTVITENFKAGLGAQNPDKLFLDELRISLQDDKTLCS